MKIGQTPEIPSAVSQASNAAQKAPAAPLPPSASATANQSAQAAGVLVTVSKSVGSLERPGTPQSPSFDEKKVEAVRTAYQEGTYVINAEAIADKLLANAQELVTRASN